MWQRHRLASDTEHRTSPIPTEAQHLRSNGIGTSWRHIQQPTRQMLVAAPSRTCPPMTSSLSRGLTARTRISAQRRPPSPQWSLSSLSSSKRHFRAWDIALHRIASTNTTLQFERLPLNHPTRTRPPTVSFILDGAYSLRCLADRACSLF
ncbi:hypothetical protein BGZ61DRAFT_49203 [Ilyonectria robusta]|uniref:uncharacterized protein n=1 Tax=Ilyonectria robusta TaxID=1079257 RepID=UPI001E8D8A63|nr:uncharacterized protein BGZ61DRAFT_49203 [Ilyonectria robusta]KAH8686983.1 hypothetical protein BGZ61DRAFT_49203 [Ilyonectria robusta]